ncbi:MAG: hypothetical protein M1827_006779 [Pycnora praestabilis]|nr:MAG: hypothetical protein M1827_006779 [Pycnora praestabilis]
MIRYRTKGSCTGQIIGTQIAVGMGVGMLNVSAQLSVQASASHQEVAAATAVFLTVPEIVGAAGAVGAAISGIIWTTNVPRKLAEYLPASAQADELLSLVASIPLISLSLSMKNYRLDRMDQRVRAKLLVRVIVLKPKLEGLVVTRHQKPPPYEIAYAGDFGKETKTIGFSSIRSRDLWE